MGREPTAYDLKNGQPGAVLVDIRGIAALLRVSARTARRLVREDGFPQPVKLRGCIRWWRDDVLDHVRTKTGVVPVANLDEKGALRDGD